MKTAGIDAFGKANSGPERPPGALRSHRQEETGINPDER
jgi:hypothetical protein